MTLPSLDTFNTCDQQQQQLVPGTISCCKTQSPGRDLAKERRRPIIQKLMTIWAFVRGLQHSKSSRLVDGTASPRTKPKSIYWPNQNLKLKHCTLGWEVLYYFHTHENLSNKLQNIRRSKNLSYLARYRVMTNTRCRGMNSVRVLKYL